MKQHISDGSQSEVGHRPDGEGSEITSWDIPRFALLRVLPLTLWVVVVGFALTFLDWEERWTPALYVGIVTGVVLAQGFAWPDPTAKLGGFFGISLFFLLTTPLLQFMPISMDHYNFYRVDGFATTQWPYTMALLVNLALACLRGVGLSDDLEVEEHRSPVSAQPPPQGVLDGSTASFTRVFGGSHDLQRLHVDPLRVPVPVGGDHVHHSAGAGGPVLSPSRNETVNFCFGPRWWWQ